MVLILLYPLFNKLKKCSTLDLSFNKIFSFSLIFSFFELTLKGVVNVILLLSLISLTYLLFLMYPLSPTKLNICLLLFNLVLMTCLDNKKSLIFLLSQELI